MKTLRWMMAGLTLLCTIVAAHAQEFGEVPYVQTPQHVVIRMLDMAHVHAGDFVIDLGSGDGRMIITAAKKYGARGFGVDLDSQLVALSNRRAAQQGVADRAKFYARDLYETDLSQASVVTMYLLPEVNLMMRPKLLATLKPGTRIVSHDYDMGDWHPDRSLVLDVPDKPVGRDKKSHIYYWVVPATVSGKWRWQITDAGRTQSFELALNQSFQKLDGTLMVAGARVPLRDVQLAGDHIAFSATVPAGGKAASYTFAGRVAHDAIEGVVKIRGGMHAAQSAWHAVRTEAWAPRQATAPAPDMPK